MLQDFMANDGVGLPLSSVSPIPTGVWGEAPLEIWSRPTIPHFNKRNPSRSERNTRRHRGAGNSFPIFS